MLKEEVDGQRSDHKALYRKARIAGGATVRWKRSITEQTSSGERSRGTAKSKIKDPPISLAY